MVLYTDTYSHGLNLNFGARPLAPKVHPIRNQLFSYPVDRDHEFDSCLGINIIFPYILNRNFRFSVSSFRLITGEPFSFIHLPKLTLLSPLKIFINQDS